MTYLLVGGVSVFFYVYLILVNPFVLKGERERNFVFVWKKSHYIFTKKLILKSDIDVD